MENKRIVPLWVGIIGLILIIGCLIWNVYALLRTIPFINLGAVEMCAMCALSILSLISALMYFFSGYKKEAAKYFKGYVYIVAIGTLVSLISVCQFGVLNVLLKALSFGILCILATGLNLGKARSFTLCIINLLLGIATATIATVVLVAPPQEYANILLGVLLFIMEYAKYSDKTARGTK